VASAAEYLRSLIRVMTRSAKRRPVLVRATEGLTVERWGITVDAGELALYRAATGAERLNRTVTGGELLPPLYSAVWETRLLLELMSDPAAPPVRGAVVHLATELLQIRVAHASATYRCRVELERVEADPRGSVLHVVTRSWNSAGQQCTESRSRYLLRDRARTGARRERGEEEVEDGSWRELARWDLRGNHGRRYARASGDYNPAHLWRLTAALVGFRRPILHGFCTAALVTHELLAAMCGGDPAALRRLRISLRRPVTLPSRPRLLVANDGSRIRFRIVDERDRAYAEGELVAGSG
jgi:acyl dehydratase